MAIAKRTHLYPYRTQKLSSLASNVVGLTPCETRTLPGNSESLPFGRFFFMFEIEIKVDIIRRFKRLL